MTISPMKPTPPVRAKVLIQDAAGPIEEATVSLLELDASGVWIERDGATRFHPMHRVLRVELVP